MFDNLEAGGRIFQHFAPINAALAEACTATMRATRHRVLDGFTKQVRTERFARPRTRFAFTRGRRIRCVKARRYIRRTVHAFE